MVIEMAGLFGVVNMWHHAVNRKIDQTRLNFLHVVQGVADEH